MRISITPVLAALLLSGCAVSPGERGATADSPADLNALAGMLTGEYTNHAQVWTAEQGGKPHPPEYQLTIVPDPSGTPDRPVLRLRQARAGESRPVRDVRLILEHAPGGGVVQRVQQRAEDGWRALDGCEIHWKRGTSGFHGTTRGDGCRFRDRRDGRVVTLRRRWTASAAGLELSESSRGADGGRSETLEWAPVSWYRGWAGVRERAEDGRGRGEWRVERRLRLHDGGAVRELPAVGGEPVAIRLERLEWPNSGINMLRLSIVEPASGEVLAYSWAPPGAERVGIHLGWLQAGLEAVGVVKSEDTVEGETE